MIAGWLPARDANQTPPAQVLARGDWSPGFAGFVSLRLAFSLSCWEQFLVPPPVVMESARRFRLEGLLRRDVGF